MQKHLQLGAKTTSLSLFKGEQGEQGEGGEGGGSSPANAGAGGEEEALLGWKGTGTMTHAQANT